MSMAAGLAVGLAASAAASSSQCQSEPMSDDAKMFVAVWIIGALVALVVGFLIGFRWGRWAFEDGDIADGCYFGVFGLVIWGLAWPLGNVIWWAFGYLFGGGA